MRYSYAMNRPSGPSVPRCAKRCSGSHPVMAESMVNDPIDVWTAPSGPGSTSLRPMNHESIPGPVAMASHTSSTLAATVTSSRCSQWWPTSGLLRCFGGRCLDSLRVVGGFLWDRRVDGQDDPVRPAAGCLLVAVLGDQSG